MTPPGKTRALFVDDEPLILELLKVTVGSAKQEWEPKFASSGEAALRLLQSESFDIVVSDMNMPGISGAQLLNEVMVHHPDTVRIILCGTTDQEQVMRCVGATHQFLTKPFQLRALKATLTRCRAMRARLPHAEIQKLLAKGDRLPSIPNIYFRIIEALEDPDCPADRIGEIVASDPGLTARLLQLVNSAFFGFAREVANPTEAVQLLGVATIRALALTMHLFSAFAPVASPDWSVAQIWEHSLRVGRLAKRLAELEEADEKFCDQALTAGLLHDVGKLILADNLGSKYFEIHTRAQTMGQPLVVLERETLGVTHAEVGAYLLDRWGLPPLLVEAVALHHEPAKTTEPVFTPLTAVHVANAFASLPADFPPGTSPNVDVAYLKQVGMADHLETWRVGLAGG